MYAEERQQAIAELVSERGRVSVNDLSERFSVTTETVRRDLSLLERMSLVRRVHGGAVPAHSLLMLESGLSERDVDLLAEKDQIAMTALRLLPTGGGTLFIDAGSTTARLAAVLPKDQRWTVVTHSVPIAAMLAPMPNIDLHVLPGRVRTATQAAVGQETVESLARLRADIAFLGTNGVTIGHGFSTPDREEAAAKRAMARHAQRVAVLADATKVGQERTVRFAELDEADVLVTDSSITPADVKSFEASGLEVIRA